jgi:hypothetical protein
VFRHLTDHWLLVRDGTKPDPSLISGGLWLAGNHCSRSGWHLLGKVGTMTEYISIGRTITADLDDATQYATIYTLTVVNGNPTGTPVGTLERARVLDKTFAWKLFNVLGECVYTWRFAPRSYQALLNTAANALNTDGFRTL